LIATPINLGANDLISMRRLVSLVEEIGGVKLERQYDSVRLEVSAAATAITR